MLALLTTLLAVAGLPSPAAAVVPTSDLHSMWLATQNMQGKSDMWGRIKRLAAQNHVVALQEVPHTGQTGQWIPGLPTGARLIGRGSLPPLPGAVREYEWNIGTTSREQNVYLYLLTTSNHPVGMVTTRRADEVREVVHGGSPRRNALVILDNTTRAGFASYHAPATPRNHGHLMVAAVADTVNHYGNPRGGNWRWNVLGDFNRHATDYLPPAPGAAAAAPYQAIQNIQAEAIPPRDQQGNLIATQQRGGTLDYLITNAPHDNWRQHAHTWASDSDHRSVMFGGMTAGAEPGQSYRFMTNSTHEPRLAITGDDSHSGDPHIDPWTHDRNQIWTADRLQILPDGHEYFRLVSGTSKECMFWGGSQVIGEVNCDRTDVPEENRLWRYVDQFLVTAAGLYVVADKIHGKIWLSNTKTPYVAGPPAPGGTWHHRTWRMERVNPDHLAVAGFPAAAEDSVSLVSRDSRRAVREQQTAARSIAEGAVHSPTFGGGRNERWIVRPNNFPGTVNLVNQESGLCLSATSLDPQKVAATHGDVCRAADPNNPSDLARMQAWEYVDGQIELSATGKKLGHHADQTPVADMALTVSTTNITRYDVFTLPDDDPHGFIRLAVMPVGDSITAGVGSSARTGYRPVLQSMLAQDAPDVQFVGSMRDPDGTRHEGHSGWRIDQISANIERWMADAKPNLVLLHIGTNDMNRDHQVSTAPQRLAGLIDQIHTSSPQTAIVVASLVPAADSTVQARVNAYNQAIPGIVADRAQRGYRITQVSMNTLSVADLDDTLHPNDNGYLKMASAFHGGVVDAARKKWIDENVTVKPAPPGSGSPATAGDYRVDINGDGRSDYLAVQDNGAVRAWTSSAAADGTVKWADQGYISSGSAQWTGEQVRFADVGGDARADYLILSPNGAVRAFINEGGDGRGGWKDAGTISTGSTAWNSTQVRFADIGGDTKADYLVVSNQGAVRAFIHTTTATGTVKWTDQGIVATGSDRWTAEDIRFADIGGDAKADYLIVDDNGAVQAYLNTTPATGTVKWENQGYIASGSADWTGEQIRFADVTGDARSEYLILAPNGALAAYENTTGTQETIRWRSLGTIATGTGEPVSRIRI
ncbi:GDSL-type esterase/lipase family protein [Streptomyces sp. NPDC098077]|uniref:GDSL-type esterase/lipase family protein n=1 Tax=Streptomyces sp. NPDC098077 TaxID=3366093 RepID=UPI0038296694